MRLHRTVLPHSSSPNRNTIPTEQFRQFHSYHHCIYIYVCLCVCVFHSPLLAGDLSPAPSATLSHPLYPRRNYKHSFHTKSRWRCPGPSETSPARVAFSLRIATRPLPPPSFSLLSFAFVYLFCTFVCVCVCVCVCGARACIHVEGWQAIVPTLNPFPNLHDYRPGLLTPIVQTRAGSFGRLHRFSSDEFFVRQRTSS